MGTLKVGIESNTVVFLSFAAAPYVERGLLRVDRATSHSLYLTF